MKNIIKNDVKCNNALIRAAEYGKLNKVKELIEQGADIYAYNNAALNCAAKQNNVEIIKYLIIDCNMVIKEIY
jgi:ankyrin repeat protein